jgi:hypothetical protein
MAGKSRTPLRKSHAASDELELTGQSGMHSPRKSLVIPSVQLQSLELGSRFLLRCVRAVDLRLATRRESPVGAIQQRAAATLESAQLPYVSHSPPHITRAKARGSSVYSPREQWGKAGLHKMNRVGVILQWAM